MSRVAAQHLTIARGICTMSVLIGPDAMTQYAAYRQARSSEDMSTRSVLGAAGDTFEQGYKLTESEARATFTKELEGREYRA